MLAVELAGVCHSRVSPPCILWECGGVWAGRCFVLLRIGVRASRKRGTSLAIRRENYSRGGEEEIIHIRSHQLVDTINRSMVVVAAAARLLRSSSSSIIANQQQSDSAVRSERASSSGARASSRQTNKSQAGGGAAGRRREAAEPGPSCGERLLLLLLLLVDVKKQC